MKKKLTILFSLALMLAVLAATPAFALVNTPTDTPFSITTVQAEATEISTTHTLFGTTQVTYEVNTCYGYNSPWGNSLSGTIAGVFVLNTATYVGPGQAWLTLKLLKGTLGGVSDFSFNGIGLYTYNGKPFTFDKVHVATDEKFVGILMQGNQVFSGSGGLSGVTESGWMYGVAIVAGPLAGVVVVYAWGYMQS